MKKLTFLLVFISTITFAQEKITTKLGDFNTVKVYNGLTVELQKGETAKVEITGSQSEDVSIKNVNGVLKIRLHFPDSFTAEDVKIVLYYTKNLAILDANEGGTIFSDETIEQQHIEVKVQEGAKIYLAVDIKHLTVKAVSGGIIELTGTAENQNVEATTGGIYEAYQLQSKQAIVTAASGATVEVNANEILDAKVRFGGNIYYIGTPEVLKTKKVIGGVIKGKN